MDGQDELALLPLRYDRLDHAEPFHQGRRAPDQPELLAELQHPLVYGDRSISGVVEDIATDGLPHRRQVRESLRGLDHVLTRGLQVQAVSLLEDLLQEGLHIGRCQPVGLQTLYLSSSTACLEVRGDLLSLTDSRLVPIHEAVAQSHH